MIDQIHCMDAVSLLQQLPDESADIVFTDPPYNVSNNHVLRRKYKSGKEAHIHMDFGEWDYTYDPLTFLIEAKRVIRPSGSIIIFSSDALFGTYKQWLSDNLYYKNTIIWCKVNPVPNFKKTNYRSSIELLLWANKDDKLSSKENFFFSSQEEMKNWFLHPICAGKERIRTPMRHPTQKPLVLCKRILNVHCKKGGLVVDPYTGFGTIPMAAKELGMCYIGGDLNPDYVAIAKKRLE